MKNRVLSEILKSDIKIINKVVIDTRVIEEGDCFIAIRGGNDFVSNAIEMGAAVVIYDDKDLKINDDKAFLVEDSVEFIQLFAKKFRENIKTKIIGITGSNGKTTSKDILDKILSVKYMGKKTLGNLNNHIGVPLTILGLNGDEDYLVLEMGMSDLGEIDLLSRISLPDFGIITNIGDSHLEFLKSRDNVFKAKTEMVPYIKNRLVSNGDDPYLENIDAVSIGYNDNNDLRIFDYNSINDLVNFKIDNGKEIIDFETNLLGKHNVLNIGFALGIASEFGIDLNELKDCIKTLSLTSMRFQKIEKENIVFINDAYNSSPVSLDASLKTFDDIYNDRVKIIVIGDMLELGEKSKEMHINIKEQLDNMRFDKLYLVGEEIKVLKNSYCGDDRVVWSSKEDISHIKREIDNIDKKAAVLLKGSRGIRLERLL